VAPDRDLPTGRTTDLVVAAAGFDGPHLDQAITAYARTIAEAAHPDHAAARDAANTAARAAEHASNAYHQTCTRYPAQLDDYGSLAYHPDPAGLLTHSTQDVADLTNQLEAANARVHAILAEPALRSLPPRTHPDRTPALGHRTAREGPVGAPGRYPRRRRTFSQWWPPARTRRGAALPRAWWREQPVVTNTPHVDPGARTALTEVSTHGPEEPTMTQQRNPHEAPSVHDELLTLSEVAAIVRAPIATLRYWRHLGTGPRSFRLGRRVVYRAGDLQAWIDTQDNAPKPAAGTGKRP